jgi:Tfp pilus assembly protein PilX
MALVLVIFAIAFLSLLAVSMFDQATTDLTILRNHTSGLAALYAAQAGIADAMTSVRAAPGATTPAAGSLTMPDGSTCTYSATISNSNPVVTITSTGTANGFTRKVRAVIVVAGAPALAPFPVRVVQWQEVVGSG